MPNNEKNEGEIEKNYFTRYTNSTGFKWDLEEKALFKLYFEKRLRFVTGDIEEVEGKEEEGTGNTEEVKISKFIKYPFERYVITLELSPNNEFIGISEVTLNRDFRSFREKIASVKSVDAEDLHFEE